MSTKIAVVTGAGRGIGRGVAERLAADGHHVVAVDVDEVAVKETAERTGGEGHVGDVADPEALTGIVGGLDRVDVLVNNAGVWRYAPLDEITPADARRILDVNLVGTLLSTQAVLPLMRGAGGGTIVNMTSVAGGAVASIRHGMYPASKAGIIALTRQMAMEFAADGIRVNAVGPGLVVTEGTMVNFGSSPEENATFGRLLPLGRLGYPPDVAGTVSFLASADAAYITGQVLFVDGGLSEVTMSLLRRAAGAPT
jgi:NAD(P)-dependent dehydrogenase (short-subunit alcohol dehydrogenase family)